MNNDFDPLKEQKLGFITRNNLKLNRYLQRKGWVKDSRYRSYPLIFGMVAFSVGYVYMMYFNFRVMSDARQGKKRTFKVSCQSTRKLKIVTGQNVCFHGINFAMERKWCKRIKQLIKDGRPAKLKSYIKKHDIDIQHLQFTNGRTILHYCCKYHDFIGFRYFIGKGICLSTKDDDGNTALHIALKEALKKSHRSEVSEIYNQLILPILEQHPESLKWRNHEDITCRDLLDQLREKQDGQCRESPEKNWEEKLTDELEDEYQEGWGSRFTGDLSEEETFQESYSDWSDRMHHEFHKKRKYSGTLPSSSKKPKSQEEDFNSKLRQERERMRKKYEENQKKAQQSYKRHQKDVYERKWQELSEKIVEKQLHFSDIPWPFKKSISELEDFLFHDLTQSEARKKYLRDQVKRWHPDKFLQKFGNHILSTDKELVLQRVKQVSQELNRLFEKFK